MKNKLQKNTITKNQLLQNDNQLVRVLDSTTDKVFIIDCIKKTMPVWTDAESLKDYLPCSEDTLQEITDTINHLTSTQDKFSPFFCFKSFMRRITI